MAPQADVRVDEHEVRGMLIGQHLGHKIVPRPRDQAVVGLGVDRPFEPDPLRRKHETNEAGEERLRELSAIARQAEVDEALCQIRGHDGRLLAIFARENRLHAEAARP